MLAAWVALCKHVRLEVVVSERGAVCGRRCQACGHLHVADADAQGARNKAYNDEREDDDDGELWTDERGELADEHVSGAELACAYA